MRPELVYCDTQVIDRRLKTDPAKLNLFQGMNTHDSIREIAFLDRVTKDRGHHDLRRSIERVISKGQYEWLTLRVREDGQLSEE